MILDLEGNPTQCVLPGEEYLVPTVAGVPVVTPSHVDEGTEGKTSRHWHADERFPIPYVPLDRLDKDYAIANRVTHFGIRHATILDDGREPTLERHRACKEETFPAGGVFSTLCWLYFHLGHLSSKDGHCAHHATDLGWSVDHGCLVCPAHGLKYNVDGSPRYKAPFFVEHAGEMILLAVPKLVFVDQPDGKRPTGLLKLIDSNGEVVSSYVYDSLKTCGPIHKGDRLIVTLDVWQKLPGNAPIKLCKAA